MRNEKGQFKSYGKNPVECIGESAIIYAVDKNGNKKRGYIVDLEDVERLLEYRWSVDTTGYAKSRSLKMHRVIMNAKEGESVDHINQDKTDNRKNNLRIASHSLQMRNREMPRGKTGVKHILKQYTNYSVSLSKKGKRYFKSGFKTIEEAINYRDNLYKEINYFGE